MTVHAGKRAGAYVRVSSEEQVDGYSLAAQERAAEAYCVQHDWEPIIYREEGRSARTDDEAKRPVFAQLLQDAETGSLDVVIVHKLDRFARNRRVAFDAFERLGKAGVGFVSIAENLDYSSPAGQLMLTMLVGMAQFYSDNLSFETKKGKAERKAQGLYNGLLPFGAAKGPDGIPIRDVTPQPHPELPDTTVIPAAGLDLAFELAAAGKSDREVARALTAAGYRTSGNRGRNPFTKDTLRVLLRNRFYVAELPDGQGGWIPGKHDPLVDPALFERAQRARAANTSRPRWTESVRSPWALSGLAVCGACGATITALSHGTGKRRIRCAGRTQGNGCEEASCYAAVIEDQIGAMLQQFLVPDFEREQLLALWRYHQEHDRTTAAERARLQRKRGRLREAYLENELERDEYLRRKAAVEQELAALPEEVDVDEATGQRLATFLKDIASAWEAANAWERNKLARQLFSQVVIVNRTVVAVVPRGEVRGFFEQLRRPGSQDGEECTGGSDGLRSHARTTSTGVVLVALPPVRRVVGLSGRAPYARPRPARLTLVERDALRAAAATGRSLRDLAADFGVSHETARSICRRGERSA